MPSRLHHALLGASLAVSTIACGPADPMVELRITGPDDTILPVSVLLVSLRGRHLEEAVRFTILQDWSQPLIKLPVTMELDLPSDPHALIEHGDGPVAYDDARFFFTVYGDLNGDGALSPGELLSGSDNGTFGPTIPTVLDYSLETWETDVDGAP